MQRRKKPKKNRKEQHAVPMKFDFDQQPRTLTGKPLKIPVLDDNDEQKFEEANLGEICKWALLEVAEPDKDSRDPMGAPRQKVLKGDEKYERYRLAQKLHPGGIIQLENKERDMIRKLIGHGFNIEAVGVLWDALDKPIPEEDKEDAEAEDADEVEAENADEDDAEAETTAS